MKFEFPSCRENIVTLETSIILLPCVRLQVCLQVTSLREGLLTMGTDIRLFPGVTPSMKFEFTSCRENFVTLGTSIVLLLSVSFDVSLQGPGKRKRHLTSRAHKAFFSRVS